MAAALVDEHGVEVRARRGRGSRGLRRARRGAARQRPADHARRRRRPADARARAWRRRARGDASAARRRRRRASSGCGRLEAQGELAVPVLAVNEARTERALNDRHGTGQSALDGIVRATNVLLAGHTLVVLGYGWAGQAWPSGPAAPGAAVIVCEVDPLRALEARMDGYEVMPALEAAERGDVFVTVTGIAPRAARRALRADEGRRGARQRRPLRRRDRPRRTSRARRRQVRQVRPLVEQYDLADGRRLNLLAAGSGRQPGRRRGPPGRGDGRLVRAPGAQRRGARARRRTSCGRASTRCRTRSIARWGGSSWPRSASRSTSRRPSRRTTVNPGGKAAFAQVDQWGRGADDRGEASRAGFQAAPDVPGPARPCPGPAPDLPGPGPARPATGVALPGRRWRRDYRASLPHARRVQVRAADLLRGHASRQRWGLIAWRSVRVLPRVGRGR